MSHGLIALVTPNQIQVGGLSSETCQILQPEQHL